MGQPITLLALLLCVVHLCISSIAGTRTPAVSALSAATVTIGRLRRAALPTRTTLASAVALPFRPVITIATVVSLCGVSPISSRKFKFHVHKQGIKLY